MKKRSLVLLISFLLLLPHFGKAGQTVNGYRIKTVVIDAGHGGHDPGTIGVNNVQEKGIALAVALKLGKYIKDNYPDVKVIFTRDKDEFIELHERAEIANRNKADLFISIHCNSSPATSAYGTEVYVLGLHETERNLAVAKRENSVILMENNYKAQYDGFDPNSPESHIIFSIFQDAHLEQSIKLASLVDNQFKSRVNRSSRGVKQAGFLVLWKTTMPSMLIELGFISNKKEEVFLNSQQGQSYMAAAIYRAFKQYKEAMEPDVEHNVTDKGVPQTTSKDEDIESAEDEVNNDSSAIDKEDAPTKSSKPVKTTTKPPTKPKATATKPEKPADKSTKSTTDKDRQLTTGKGIVYKVQFLASKVALAEKDPQLKKVKDYEVEHTDYYRYFAGNFKTLDDAVAYQTEIRKNGFPSAFVVAYQDGKRTPLNKLKP